MGAAKITLFGMIRWQEDKGGDLFSKLTLPDGIDKEILIGNLMLTAGEFGVLYADGDFMTEMIGIWGRKHYRTFDKWIKALNTEYEPLYNLDVYEEWQDIGSHTNETSGKYGDTEVTEEDITDTNDLTSETNGNNETENTRSAFDSSAYQPHDKQVVTAGSMTADTGDVVRDRDQSVTRNGTRTGKDTGTEQGSHTGHRYGNQGITMSQQMLQSELDVQKWNIYEHMTDLFVQEFCIPVYI